MEKRRPHFILQVVLSLVSKPDAVRFTGVARRGAAELGMTVDDMLAVLASLTLSSFYISMTTYADSGQWQDVYRPDFRGKPLYLKLTIVPDEQLLVVSFKRR